MNTEELLWILGAWVGDQKLVESYRRRMGEYLDCEPESVPDTRQWSKEEIDYLMQRALKEDVPTLTYGMAWTASGRMQATSQDEARRLFRARILAGDYPPSLSDIVLVEARR